ncbi:type IV pilin [Halorubrum sp. GN11GM_10-3_MGM]|uniref:type IV pilin n=1 Tax=Halorubrum sp. GN11GM_10-3_MGM TaxID=2518111 RepID=UPI0010F9F337|nr:type IV pilin N-terminal domain-containing protein [Halorubrum sp. GN11GM_10-3_MGM]TKX66088.1 type IV pilin [Halorubrum sp. GN11GM_10-3_MGM]
MPPHMFNADDRAVSPASAVMLMTVISVLLAATVGGVVLGAGVQGGDDPSTVQLTADIDASADAVTIAHAGGDPVATSEYEVVAYADGAVVDRTAVGTDRLATDERVTVDYATGGDHAVDELRVVHAPSESVVATDALADPVRDFGGWA